MSIREINSLLEEIEEGIFIGPDCVELYDVIDEIVVDKQEDWLLD